ncbi:MAG: serine protease [Sporichthyaceae bacterium]
MPTSRGNQNRTTARRAGQALVGVSLLLSAATFSAPAASASESPDAKIAASFFDDTQSWAQAALATVRPGVQTQTRGSGQCTANFVYTTPGKVYLGQAAHCSGTGESTETNGCTAKTLPLGTKVDIPSAGVTGTMVYNSWLLMQKLGEKNDNACNFNDLALIEIPSSALSKVNPSIPVFGGPTGVNVGGTQPGESVVSYGNSQLRGGLAFLSPKTGTSLGTVGEGWSHSVYTLTPGIPGDSGSAFLDSQGRALGDLSTLALAPTPLSNQVSDLAHALAYARTNAPGFEKLRVVKGTEPFIPSALPLPIALPIPPLG